MSHATEESGRVLGYAGSLLEPGVLSSAFYAGAAPALGRHVFSRLIYFYWRSDLIPQF
jgi:hypothetical protein